MRRSWFYVDWDRRIISKPMKNQVKLSLAFFSMIVASVALVGCGSGETDVDQNAVNARNSQRAGSAGAPPAPGGAPAGTPAPTPGG